jgi:hypothetical protein
MSQEQLCKSKQKCINHAQVEFKGYCEHHWELRKEQRRNHAYEVYHANKAKGIKRKAGKRAPSKTGDLDWTTMMRTKSEELQRIQREIDEKSDKLAMMAIQEANHQDRLDQLEKKMQEFNQTSTRSRRQYAKLT